MPRRPRIHLAGVPLHSVQRGHNREACVFGEEDSLAYPHRLGEALKESGCALHAYVLMTNPVHLAADSTAAPRGPPAHHLARARLRGVHQQNLSPHRHAVG
jgi:putative transposase